MAKAEGRSQLANSVERAAMAGVMTSVMPVQPAKLVKTQTMTIAPRMIEYRRNMRKLAIKPITFSGTSVSPKSVSKEYALMGISS